MRCGGRIHGLSTADRLRSASSSAASTSSRSTPLVTRGNVPRLPSLGMGWTLSEGTLTSGGGNNNRLICRITNTSEEIYRNLGIKPSDLTKDLFVNQTQVLYPELGPLEGRVTKMYLEELFSDNAPDLEETAYWFHTPAEGWKMEPTRLSHAEEAEVTFANPFHSSWKSEGRLRIDELEVDQVITGVISDVWLYHGCQVDFGYMFDGLIPISEEQWLNPTVAEALMPGDEILARVYRVRQPGLYRWPVQLQLLEPLAAARLVMKPGDYEASVDHGWADRQGWGIDEILKATKRDYQASSYVLPQNQSDMSAEIHKAYGYDIRRQDAMHLPNRKQEQFLRRHVQNISQYHDLGRKL